MNTLTFTKSDNGYVQWDVPMIDGIPLYRYFEECIEDDISDSVAMPFRDSHDLEDLSFVWIEDYYGYWRGIIDFVWGLIESEEDAAVPVLVCPEDPELDCLTLVAYVRKDNEYVYWDRIGRVILPDADNAHDSWLLSGYKCKEVFSEEKCQQFGPETPVYVMDDYEAGQWIDSHGREEFCRRYENYYGEYYKQPGAVRWLSNVHWVFARNDYQERLMYLRDTYSKVYQYEEIT